MFIGDCRGRDRMVVICTTTYAISEDEFFYPLCSLLFFDIWILVTPLVSSNSSYNIIVYQIHLVMRGIRPHLLHR
jgi:hypothetical protein